MIDDPRVRTAYHEAGHAVAAALYRQPLALVSIRPGEAYAGITAYEPSPDRFAGFEPSYPVPLQDPGTRARVEADLITTLAGAIAGNWAVPVTGYVADDDDQAAQRAAVAIATLTPRHRELLMTLEADPVGMTDDDARVEKLAGAWVGHAYEASIYLAWLRVVAERLVADFWPEITALATALLAHTVLDGAQVEAVMRSARKPQAS